MGVEQYFAGMDRAKSMSGGQYFHEGKFLLTLKRMFVNEGHKGRFFIAEFLVNSSDQNVDPSTGRKPDAEGSTRSWTAPLTGERARYSMGDIKDLIFALTGHDPKSCGTYEENPQLHAEAMKLVMSACDPEYAKKVDEDPSLLIDQQVQLETTQKPNKTKPGVFTVHRWSPAT